MLNVIVETCVCLVHVFYAGGEFGVCLCTKTKFWAHLKGYNIGKYTEPHLPSAFNFRPTEHTESAQVKLLSRRSAKNNISV